VRLTRRDALVALAGLGVVAGGSTAVLAPARDPPAGVEAVEPTLVAAAGAIYPSAVDGVPEFVRTYARGRTTDPDHREGLAGAVSAVEDAAERWYDAPYPELNRENRDRLLRELGADTAEPVPDGTTAERVRYYVVNDLLYALFTSPTGGELVGTENPVGHPGGTTSYRRGPQGGDDGG